MWCHQLLPDVTSVHWSNIRPFTSERLKPAPSPPCFMQTVGAELTCSFRGQVNWVLAFSCRWLLLLLLSHFSRSWLCATPQMAAHQAPASLGFSRQEQWSGVSDKWKWSFSVVSDSQPPHGLQPTRLLRPWDFPGKSIGVGCHCLPLSPIKVELTTLSHWTQDLILLKPS